MLDPENRRGLLVSRGITAAFLDGRFASAPPLRLRREGLMASRSWPIRACWVYHIRDLFRYAHEWPARPDTRREALTNSACGQRRTHR